MSARLIPDRRGMVDLGLLLACCTVALLGLGDSFAGPAYAVVGVLGLLLGTTIAHAGRSLGWPRSASLLLLLAVLFLLGPPLCLRGADTPWPTPAGLAGVVDQLAGGWKDLLTTLPPVDGDGPLLVLPWALGLGAGWLGVQLLNALSRPAWLAALLPVLVPVLLLVGVMLLGVDHPVSLTLQGGVFAGLVLWWLVVRSAPPTAAGDASRRAGRAMGVLGMLLVAGAVAVPLVAAVQPTDDERLHLREHVAPPFDIGRYPSPLSSFRRYVKMPEPDAVNLYEETLMQVDGVPAGTRLRFAALDHYDGVVWGAAEDTDPATSDDTFQRVSSTIDNPVEGTGLTATVEIAEGYRGVWLPTVGSLQGLEFLADDPRELGTDFRYNLATSTAVVPSGLQPGDRYRMRVVVPADAVDENALPAAPNSTAQLSAGFLDTPSVQWSAGESEPMRRVFAVAQHLKIEGKYSDGVLAAEKIYHPGHHERRLWDEFANAPIMVGNDEQYAAIMALLANRIGVPARVVMGAVVPESGEVRGADVQAWVELQVADGSWRTLPTEEFMDTDRPAEQPPRTEQEMSGSVVPPPAPIPPPSTAGEQTDAELQARKRPRDTEEAGGLPAWLRVVLVYVGGPLLLVALLVGLVVGAKAMRRYRRRTTGRPSARVVGAWHELVDHARDLGTMVPSRATRREQSGVLGGAAPALARVADAHVFGRRAPDGPAAADFWGRVDTLRREMSEGVGRRRRLLAAVSLRTFRR